MTKKILVVEDDHDLRRGLRLRLGLLGYDVVTAQDGLGAVQLAMREQPHLVLLDLGLPGGDGLSVLERFANLPRLEGIPVVVVTGRDPAVAEPAAQRHHVAGFLRKPVDNAQLDRTIKAALGTDEDQSP